MILKGILRYDELFDVAESYGNGNARHLLGYGCTDGGHAFTDKNFLREERTEKIVIMIKFG